jgi:hypothetical protein
MVSLGLMYTHGKAVKNPCRSTCPMSMVFLGVMYSHGPFHFEQDLFLVATFYGWDYYCFGLIWSHGGPIYVSYYKTTYALMFGGPPPCL